MDTFGTWIAFSYQEKKSLKSKDAPAYMLRCSKQKAVPFRINEDKPMTVETVESLKATFEMHQAMNVEVFYW